MFFDQIACITRGGWAADCCHHCGLEGVSARICVHSCCKPCIGVHMSAMLHRACQRKPVLTARLRRRRRCQTPTSQPVAAAAPTEAGWLDCEAARLG